LQFLLRSVGRGLLQISAFGAGALSLDNQRAKGREATTNAAPAG
jgi:hypothetical protein